MDIKDKIDAFLWSVAAKHAVAGVVKVVLAFLASAVVTSELAKYGVKVDPAILAPSLTSGLFAALDVAHSWLQKKTGLAWL